MRRNKKRGKEGGRRQPGRWEKSDIHAILEANWRKGNKEREMIKYGKLRWQVKNEDGRWGQKVENQWPGNPNFLKWLKIHERAWWQGQGSTGTGTS